jgi:hypothetical protein
MKPETTNGDVNASGRQRRLIVDMLGEEVVKPVYAKNLVLNLAQFGALLILLATVLAFSLATRADATQALTMAADHEQRLRVTERSEARMEAMLETIKEDVSRLVRLLEHRTP